VLQASDRVNVLEHAGTVLQLFDPFRELDQTVGNRAGRQRLFDYRHGAHLPQNRDRR
jgi:hypothetical protein